MLQSSIKCSRNYAREYPERFSVTVIHLLACFIKQNVFFKHEVWALRKEMVAREKGQNRIHIDPITLFF